MKLRTYNTGRENPLRKLTMLIAGFATIALLATSCGGSSESTDSAPSQSESSSSPQSSTEEPGSSANEEETAAPSKDLEVADDCPTAGDARDDLFPGVMFFSEAQTRCLTDIDWGDRCDIETGRLKLPVVGAPECFAPFSGDNGGETARGVTEDSITIVYWRWQENDFILNYITGPIAGDDTNADAEASLRRLLQYYETYYETYGRKVNLIFYEGCLLYTSPSPRDFG